MKDEVFFEKLIESLEECPDKDLEDPIMYNTINIPLMLSSGVVMDRDSMINENGRLRFDECPFSK